MDLEARYFVYQHFVETGRAPAGATIATHFNLTSVQTKALLQRLHDRHFLFLDPDTQEIRIAAPFSAIPTRFKVHSQGKTYWANCAWDMLGIPAALKQDAFVEAFYSDTQDTVSFEVIGDDVRHSEGAIHFPLPVRQWYDDLIHT